VRGACFYLQTSIYEGMAMSVVEAMQLGLLPVVTPVGEIGSYCRDGGNAVVVNNDERAVADVLHLLTDPAAYGTLRQQAIEEWLDKPLYRESVLAACEALTQQDQHP
jgi:glycosyltransferase involved in cell wall biosynthesis